ncbi:MAG: protein kinase, partial [Acidobacteria bacterium]|nr:protein kinase [Acidobacteriota bacterium]
AVGEALGAAHARGIIHRDIKPSNVLVSKEGEVKVLDFGLVKHLHEDHPQEAGPDANTLLARTSSNVIIGTPLYLSPEQAMGTAVDARSDIFALGALLYESLTGRPAFSGGSVIEIGARILHFNPPPPSSINKRVHPELDRITLKALAKKPESRYQTASEMVADLRATRNALDNEDGYRTQRLVASKPSHSSAFKSISESLRRPRLSLGFFAFALLIATAGAWYILQPDPEKKRVPFQNMPVTKVTNTGKSLSAEVSPDGKYIAQVLGDAGQQSLVLTYLATASNVLIAPPADVRYHAITFSNDGNYIYYVRYEKTEIGLLYQVPALSGTSRKILSNVDSKITFAPDGKRFAFVRFDKSKGEYSLMIAQADGRAPAGYAKQPGSIFALRGSLVT